MSAEHHEIVRLLAQLVEDLEPRLPGEDGGLHLEGRLGPVLVEEALQLAGALALDQGQRQVSFRLSPLRGHLEEAEGEDGPHLDLPALRALSEELHAATERVGGQRRQVDRSQDTPGRHPQLAPHHQHGTGGAG
jgi:hypothetical protein